MNADEFCKVLHFAHALEGVLPVLARFLEQEVDGLLSRQYPDTDFRQLLLPLDLPGVATDEDHW